MLKTIEIEDFYGYTPTRRYGYEGLFPSHARIEYILSQGQEAYQQLMSTFVQFMPQFLKISKLSSDNRRSLLPCWQNPFFPPLDGIALFGLLSSLQPKIYLEVGSGNSTKFAALAKRLNSPKTKIISIDPRPRAEIDQLCDQVIRAPLEELNPTDLPCLRAKDIFFFDGSHRVLQNSDTQVMFLDILPLLNTGVYIHIHDIHWPSDYPGSWEKRYYNEQYLLGLLLLFGQNFFQIVLPNAYISWHTDLTNMYRQLWEAPQLKGIERHGASFWMKKITD